MTLSNPHLESLLRSSRPPAIQETQARKARLEQELQHRLKHYAPPEPLSTSSYLRIAASVLVGAFMLASLQSVTPDSSAPQKVEVYGRGSVEFAPLRSPVSLFSRAQPKPPVRPDEGRLLGL